MNAKMHAHAPFGPWNDFAHLFVSAFQKCGPQDLVDQNLV